MTAALFQPRLPYIMENKSSLYKVFLSATKFYITALTLRDIGRKAYNAIEVVM
jgi:hypothetical protein